MPFVVTELLPSLLACSESIDRDGEGAPVLLRGEEGEEGAVVAGGGREARLPHRPLRRQLLELHPRTRR